MRAEAALRDRRRIPVQVLGDVRHREHDEIDVGRLHARRRQGPNAGVDRQIGQADVGSGPMEPPILPARHASEILRVVRRGLRDLDRVTEHVAEPGHPDGNRRTHAESSARSARTRTSTPLELLQARVAAASTNPTASWLRPVERYRRMTVSQPSRAARSTISPSTAS